MNGQKFSAFLFKNFNIPLLYTYCLYYHFITILPPIDTSASALSSDN